MRWAKVVRQHLRSCRATFVWPHQAHLQGLWVFRVFGSESAFRVRSKGWVEDSGLRNY